MPSIGWGALQGFGPAIALAIKRPDLCTTPYLGHQPGPYANYFVFFPIGRAPLLALAALLVRRFRLRALARRAAVAA